MEVSERIVGHYDIKEAHLFDKIPHHMPLPYPYLASICAHG